MESLILQQDRKDLIKINRSLTPDQRLEAFYQHSQLMVQLSLSNKLNKKQEKKNSAFMRTTAQGQSSLLLLDVIDFLNKRNIAYAIIGAFAASYYGMVRASLDADAVISINSPKDAADLCLNLRSMDLKADYRKGDGEDPIAGVINIEDKFLNRVDLLIGIRGMRQEAFDRCQEAQFMGSPIKIVSIEDFIALKIFAGSPKDIGDVMGVFDVSREKIDLNSLKEITSQYGGACLQKLRSILKV